MTELKIDRNKINHGNAGFLIGAIILFASSCLAIIFVHKQFAGYDISPIIDLSWRLTNNQIPGDDFVNTMPPLFIVFIKFISFGNLRWIDLTIVNIIATIGAYFFLFFASDNREESVWWGLFIAIVLAIPLVYTNHIWPSSLTQLSGIIFFYSVYIAINSHYLNMKILVSLLLVSGILAISKQNVALPMTFTVVVFLFFLKQKNRIILISTILSGSFVGIFLSIIYLGYSLDGFLYSYYAVLERAPPASWVFRYLAGMESQCQLAILMLIICAVFLYFIFKNSNRINQVNKIYFLLVFAISFLPIITDWDSKFNNVSLPLFIIITGMFASINSSVYGSTYQQRSSHPVHRVLITIFVLFTIYIISFMNGYVREGMMHRGLYSFYDPDAKVVINEGYFSGLKTGNRLAGVLKEISMVKNELLHEKLFFGPCMEFGYLHTNTKSPKGMPLWWHRGTSYGAFDSDRIVENFIQNKFDVLIFLKVFSHEQDGRMGMSTELIKHILENYRHYNEYQYIEVYKKMDPNLFLSHYKQGNVHARLKQYDLAIKHYNQANVLNPDHADTYVMRGIIYLQLGQYQKAIQDFDESILVKPLYVVNRDDILVYYHRGIAYIKNGQYQLAIKDFSKIIYLNSDYGDAYSIRGAIYLNIKNQELGCLDAYKACNLGNCNLLRVAQSNGVCN